MIAPLLAAALIATPIQTPDHFDLAQERSVNVAKPMHGGYSDQIAAAASVPNPWIKFSKCVLDRESGGTLTRKNSGEGAKNPRSSASGRWQFLDTHWRHGGSFMVRTASSITACRRTQRRSCASTWARHRSTSGTAGSKTPCSTR